MGQDFLGILHMIYILISTIVSDPFKVEGVWLKDVKYSDLFSMVNADQ